LIVKEIIKLIDEFFPLKLQEKYDNSGEQVVFEDENVESILFSLDVDINTVEEAIQKKCNLIVTHHPFFFNPLKKIKNTNPDGKLLIKLIENKISLYAAHTNLDSVYFSKLSSKIGFDSDIPIYRNLKIDDGNNYGFGSIVSLDVSMSLIEVVNKVKKSLELEYILYSGADNWDIKSIGFLNGAGGSKIFDLVDNRELDCIVTGDATFHGVKYAFDNNVACIDAGHFGTEKILIDFLILDIQDVLTKNGYNKQINLIKSNTSVNPFKLG